MLRFLTDVCTIIFMNIYDFIFSFIVPSRFYDIFYDILFIFFWTMFSRSIMSVVKSKRLCGCPFSWYPRWGCCYVPARIWNGLGRHSDSRKIENCSISAQIRRSGKDYKVMILDHLSWDGFQFHGPASSKAKRPFYKSTYSTESE